MANSGWAHKLLNVVVILVLVLNPLRSFASARQGSATQAVPADVGAETFVSLSVHPCENGFCTDTTQADFETGMLTNLDTTSEPGTVRLGLRPLPIANAGPDQTVNEGDTISRDGSASFSPTGDVLTYAWTQVAGPAGTLFAPDSSRPTFVPPDIVVDKSFGFKLVVNDGLANSVPDTVNVTVIADNDAPVAHAGPDQTAHEGTLVTLDGSGSSDVNGDPLTFAWTQTAGTPASLSDPSSPQPTFTAPDVSRDEYLTFQLTVNDGEMDSSPDTVQVLVTADNELPAADAGPDQQVDSGSLVNLDGSGSNDPNGDALTYRWAQTSGTPVTLMGPDTANPIFVAPYVTTEEMLSFQLTVSDGELDSLLPDTVQVTVRAQSGSRIDFNWTVTGEGVEIWSDYLWQFRWFGCDAGHDNIYEPLYPSGYPICGTPNCPGQPEWPFCWGPPYTQPSYSGSGINWTIESNGSFNLNYAQDYQVYALTYLYVESNTYFDPDCGRDREFTWLDGQLEEGALNLTAGWHYLELTGYNQNQSSRLHCNANLAANVDLMTSNPEQTRTLRTATDGGAATITLADGDKDLGTFSATPQAQQGGLFFGPGPITYTVSADTPDVRVYFSDTLTDVTYDPDAHVIAGIREPLPSPTISSFTPGQGQSGTEVTINGEDFDATNPANNKVFFNNVLATVVSASATSLTVRVPQEATSGPITVSTPFGATTSSADFTVTGQEVSPQASRLSTAASALTSLQADPLSGAASTSIPIAVPPGRQGVEPSLALDYKSSGGNGWAGVGWDLHLSYIQRSTQHGKPAYDDNTDTFIVNVPGAKLNLDNVELVRIGGDEFRARIESSFARFVFNGTYWEAWDKDGTRYLFGSDTGQATNAYGTFKWYLDRVVDTNGNYMELSYTTDQGELYLSRIAYTGSEITGDPPRHQVNFHIEPRPDAASSFVSGARVITAKRLSAIEVRTSGQLVRRYELGYAISAGSGRSLLSSVTEYGSAGMTALPVVRFRYQHARGAWILASEWTVPQEAAFTTGDNDDLDNGVRLVDVNGDALVDLVQADGTDADDIDRHRTWLNTATGWTLSTGWVVPQGVGFTIGDNDDEDNAVRLADVNGDALVDLVQSYGTDAGRHRVYRNTGTGWSLDSPWSVPADAGFVTDSGEDNAVRLADVNGDGLADLVQSYGTDPGRQRVWLNTGSGWQLSDWTVPAEAGFVTDDGGNNGVQLADVNGDGLDDLVQSHGHAVATHRVWLNNNAGWEAATAIVPLGTEFVESFDDRLDNGVRFADVNGDRRVDFIQADGGLAGQHRVWWNNGLAWDNPVYNVPLDAAFTEPSNGHADNGIRLADVNGDGLIELIQSDGGDAGQHRVWLNTSPAPDLLVEVANGIGGKSTVTYQPSTAYDNTGDDDRPDLPFVVQTAVVVTTDDGLGHTYPMTTTYAGGFFDGLERDFRGFRYARVTDPDGNYTESWFHQDDTYKGKLERTEVRDAGGALLRQVTNTWDVTEPYPGSTFVFVGQADTTFHDGGTSYTTRVRYEYDGYGNTTAVLNEGDIALAGDEVYAYTEYAENTTTWVLALPSHTTVKDAGGTKYAETWSNYDGLPNGQVENGNLTKKRSWLDTGPVDPEVTFGYDAYGNVVSKTNARGKTTTTAYDSIYHTFPETVTNPLQHTVTRSYDPKTGEVLQATDANGHTTYNEYDVFGTLVKTIQPTDSEAYPTLSYEYDLTTLPIKTTVAARERRGLSGVWLSYAFSDGLGRSLQKLVEGRDGRYIAAESVVYNARGLVEHQLTPYFVSAAVYDPPDLNKAHSSFAYDALGRLVQTTNPDDTTVTKVYTGRRTRVIDEEGHATTYTNDGLGRLIRVEEENGGKIYTSTYQYDPLNNLVRTVDNAGNVTTMTYDSLGRKIAMRDPDMGDWEYAYDANGNLIRQIDGKRQTIHFQYDDLNRLILKDYPTGTDVTYTYDDPGVPNAIGRLTRVTDAVGTTSFAYDELGRTIKEAKVVDGVTYTVLKSYDTLSRLTQLVYPDGASVAYTYDSGSNLEQVSGDGVNYITYNDYNARGQVLQATYGNGVVTNYTYDDRTFRLGHLLTRKDTTTLQDLSYTFDDIGNITHIADAVNASTQDFEYDDLYRLTQATGVGWSRQYSYDSIGNITYKSDVGDYIYGENGAGPHAVTKAGANTYTYDANGNMTAGAGRTMAYDYENRLTSVETITHTVTFAYDGDGGRVKKTVTDGTSITTTVYIGQLYEVTDGVATRHIFAGNNRVASVESTGHTYYYHQDHLGSSNSITDEAGQQVQLLEYYPFGEVRVNRSVPGVDVKHKFTGQELDVETRLYFYGARYYDPDLGRFISADPIVQAPFDPQTLNRYAYSRNNPVKYVDPTGHFFGLGVILGAVVGAGIGATVAALTGGDIGMASLTGAISGAFFGFVGDLGLSEFAESELAETVGHAWAGATSGAINARITGQDTGLGALTGAVSAGVAKWLGSKGSNIKFLQPVEGTGLGAYLANVSRRATIGAIVGGATSAATGGSIGYGAKRGAISAAIAYAANDWNPYHRYEQRGIMPVGGQSDGLNEWSGRIDSTGIETREGPVPYYNGADTTNLSLDAMFVHIAYMERLQLLLGLLTSIPLNVGPGTGAALGISLLLIHQSSVPYSLYRMPVYLEPFMPPQEAYEYK